MRQLLSILLGRSLLILCVFGSFSPVSHANNAGVVSPDEREWWKEGIVYQIYPRSFNDSDGDGVGDIPGIIQKLDYIKSLGVNIIWLNPVCDSPNADNGYDIRDYQNIMAEFGTMQDFDALLAGLHQRDIKLVMDLVVNHTSDEHEWFQQSRSARDNPYRDFYHWWPAEKGEPPHRVGFFDDEGKGWNYDDTTNAYYLHYFAEKQPDLNWENPKVRKAIYDMMHFWLKKGVDGFRMDVIPFISKDTSWPVVTEAMLAEKYGTDVWGRYYADGPKLHDYLKEMNREVLQHYDAMALGEGAGVTIDNAMDFVCRACAELDLFFHFDGQLLGYSELGYKRLNPQGWQLDEFKSVYTRWSDVFADDGWGSIYLGNHDQPRMVTRWGNDSPEHRVASSKLLHTFLLSMRGTPFIYFGDEIGMTNIRFNHIEQYKDIEPHSWYKQIVAQGLDPAPYLEDWKITARDNGRTPMQWSDGQHAGFSNGTPWIAINPDHKTVNVNAAEQDSDSILAYFRDMVALRKNSDVLIYGDYSLLLPDHPSVYAYQRSLGEESLTVLLNFSTESASITLPTSATQVLMNNLQSLERQNHRVTLAPYQAVILR